MSVSVCAWKTTSGKNTASAAEEARAVGDNCRTDRLLYSDSDDDGAGGGCLRPNCRQQEATAAIASPARIHFSRTLKRKKKRTAVFSSACYLRTESLQLIFSYSFFFILFFIFILSHFHSLYLFLFLCVASGGAELFELPLFFSFSRDQSCR